MATKFVFITGGVVSSLGKGITAAALGRLLKCRGYSVSVCKLDPYLNVDPGTMNPYQHGEVYVTDDGAETDLDIGHYERFIDEKLSRDNNATSGQIYQTVIERERAGGYNGGTVQIIPHITDEIQARVMRAAARTNPDVLIVEIGGTVGDIEGQPFLEAIRQIRWPGKQHVYPCNADSISARGGRTQIQTNAAQREGAAFHRHPAGYSRLPQRNARWTRSAREDCTLLQCGCGLRD